MRPPFRTVSLMCGFALLITGCAARARPAATLAAYAAPLVESVRDVQRTTRQLGRDGVLAPEAELRIQRTLRNVFQTTDRLPDALRRLDAATGALRLESMAEVEGILELVLTYLSEIGGSASRAPAHGVPLAVQTGVERAAAKARALLTHVIRPPGDEGLIPCVAF